MNYNFFELHVENDDTSVIKCNGPITSNVVTYKIIPSGGFKFDLNKIDNRSGIYVIRSISDEGTYKYYIGQTIDIKTRMQDHKNDDSVVYDYLYCTISDNRSNDLQTYIQCIETELIDRADKVKLLNKNTKKGSKFKLPEHKQTIVNEYADVFIAMANILGYKELFDQQQKRDNNDSTNWVAVKLSGKNGAKATGRRYFDNTVMVLKGSKCNDRTDTPKKYPTYESDCKLLRSLIEVGSVSSELVFLEDVLFDSPSRAARIVLENSSNGLNSWKTDEGLLLKDHLNRE